MRRTVLAMALLTAACQTSPPTPPRPDASVGESPVTFNNQVVRVFQRHCQACHRPGEVAPIAKWVAAGGPEGDRRDLPAPRRFPTGWTLGTPGAVIAMEEPFTVPPRSKDIYRCFTVPLRIAGNASFIQASEVLPGNRKVVHHVQTFLDLT